MFQHDLTATTRAYSIAIDFPVRYSHPEVAPNALEHNFIEKFNYTPVPSRRSTVDWQPTATKSMA